MIGVIFLFLSLVRSLSLVAWNVDADKLSTVIIALIHSLGTNVLQSARCSWNRAIQCFRHPIPYCCDILFTREIIGSQFICTADGSQVCVCVLCLWRQHIGKTREHLEKQNELRQSKTHLHTLNHKKNKNHFTFESPIFSCYMQPNRAISTSWSNWRNCVNNNFTDWLVHIIISTMMMDLDCGCVACRLYCNVVITIYSSIIICLRFFCTCIHFFNLAKFKQRNSSYSGFDLTELELIIIINGY